MYIGLGIVLLVLGLILDFDVITVDIKYIDEDVLGTILTVAGILAIVLSLLVTRGRRPVADDTEVVEDRRLR